MCNDSLKRDDCFNKLMSSLDLKSVHIDCASSSISKSNNLQNKYKFLIVNDEPFQLLIMVQILQNLKDVEIVTAINGDLAVR